MGRPLSIFGYFLYKIREMDNIRSKSVVNHGLAVYLKSIKFEECSTEYDFVSYVDYIGNVGEKAFGIQIRTFDPNTNFQNHSISNTEKNDFQDFEEEFSGKVFIVFSLDGEIGNMEIIKDIESEIERLKNL